MKQCLFCKKVYADELLTCPECARASYKKIEETQVEQTQAQNATFSSPYQTPYKTPKNVEYYENQVKEEAQEQIVIDETKLPKIKTPNPFIVFGIILFVFVSLVALCFII